MPWPKGRRLSREHRQRLSNTKVEKALGTVIERTTTERRIPVDHSKQAILDALRSAANLVLEGWAAKILSLPGVEYLVIAKRIRGEYVDVTGPFHPGGTPPEGWEAHILQANWGGPGVYHFQIVHKSEVVGGRVFKIGGPEAITLSEGGLDDADAALSRTFKRMELLQGSKIVGALEKKFGLDGGEGTTDMKPEDYRAILEGVRAMQPAAAPDNMTPLLLKMWESAEQRNQTLITTLLTERNKPDPTMTIIPSIVDGLKILGPRVLGPAMSTMVERFFPAAAVPTGGWTMEGVMELVKAASPVVQGLIDGFIKMAASRMGNGGPAQATVIPNTPEAIAAAAAPTAEDAMRQPQEPSPEQLAAMRAQAEIVALLKGWLAAGDYEAAFESMDTTPPFDAWTARLDTTRPAQVYAPFLMTVLGLSLVDAAQTVERFYQILLREDEAQHRAADEKPPDAPPA
jgi:hypothetical protein